MGPKKPTKKSIAKNRMKTSAGGSMASGGNKSFIISKMKQAYGDVKRNVMSKAKKKNVRSTKGKIDNTKFTTKF